MAKTTDKTRYAANYRLDSKPRSYVHEGEARLCSRWCGGHCRQADHDRATKEAQKTADSLRGVGWAPRVWENLGWHWEATNGAVRVDCHNGRFSAWIAFDDLLVSETATRGHTHGTVTQFFGYGATAQIAVDEALAKLAAYTEKLLAESAALARLRK